MCAISSTFLLPAILHVRRSGEMPRGSSRLPASKALSKKHCLSCTQSANYHFITCKECKQRVHTRCYKNCLTSTLEVYTCCADPLPFTGKRKLTSPEHKNMANKKNRREDDNLSSSTSNGHPPGANRPLLNKVILEI